MINAIRVGALARTLFAALLALASTGALAQQDLEGSRDHPLFNRLSGFFIEDYKSSDFDSYPFRVKVTPDDYKEQAVEGKLTHITYRPKEGTRKPSSLAIVRNYQNAVAQAGGKLLWEQPGTGDRLVTLLLAKGGREYWVEVAGGDGGDWYTLAIVEKGGMAQEISASDIFDALAKQGRIALYINFDTGKATIKAESQPIVKQVVDMMKAHPELKVAVEGHTDSAGSPASNKALSDQRAKAVMAAIKAQGIAPARLSAAGFGQEKPVADNATEDGRAKNRRVELVRK
jgi:outer membrane protein OmpA-like peptidoglycan-associated protein